MELACTLCGADAERDNSRQSLGDNWKSRRIIILHSIFKLPVAKCPKYLEEDCALGFCPACDALVENGLQLVEKVKEVKGQLSVVRDKLLIKVKVGAGGQMSELGKDLNLGQEGREKSNGIGTIRVFSLANVLNIDEGTGYGVDVGVVDRAVDEMGVPCPPEIISDYNWEVAEHCECVIADERGEIPLSSLDDGAENELVDVERSRTPSEMNLNFGDDSTPPKSVELKTLAHSEIRRGRGRPKGSTKIRKRSLTPSETDSDFDDDWTPLKSAELKTLAHSEIRKGRGRPKGSTKKRIRSLTPSETDIDNKLAPQTTSKLPTLAQTEIRLGRGRPKGSTKIRTRSLTRRQYLGSRPKFACLLCDALFDDNVSIKAHYLGGSHGAVIKWNCGAPGCGAKFLRPGALYFHRKHVHKNIIGRIGPTPAPFPCDLCPKRFLFAKLLISHYKHGHGQERN